MGQSQMVNNNNNQNDNVMNEIELKEKDNN